MKLIIALLGCLCSLMAMANESLSVYVDKQATPQIQYQQGQRLSQVLSQLSPADSTYWPAGRLEPLADSALAQQKARLLAKFNALTVIPNQSLFIQQLATLPLKNRAFYSVEPDRVRLDLMRDPLLEGEFRFHFPKRPDLVRFMGALKSTASLAHKPGAKVADYLSQLQLQDDAERGVAWVIQPDGKVEVANIGYWFKPTVAPAPGAIVYLGFSGSELNRDIAELLRYHEIWWN